MVFGSFACCTAAGEGKSESRGRVESSRVESQCRVDGSSTVVTLLEKPPPVERHVACFACYACVLLATGVQLFPGGVYLQDRRTYLQIEMELEVG